VLFITTLEFLDGPLAAVHEAVRVARRGLILIVLNRWSAGGLSRRVGPQARGALLGQARDWTLPSLQTLAGEAAGARLAGLLWTSTLFPDGLWAARWRVPLGDILGMALILAEPQRESVPRSSLGFLRRVWSRQSQVARGQLRPTFGSPVSIVANATTFRRRAGVLPKE
jgi:hypothetical protein